MLKEVMKKWLINFRRRIKLKFVKKFVTIKKYEETFLLQLAYISR